MNRLRTSSSPYLLQHADDPVDWWPWGPEAFAEAARRDVPVLVSSGYAACHWCHVMREESFSDPGLARLLNENLVAIKVDREQHPGVDAAYLHATLALTGAGGWPMNVFTTPDGRPFFAGTYFPPVRDGRPSFTEVVAALVEAWQQRRDEVLESAAVTVERLRASSQVEVVEAPSLKPVLEELAEAYDPVYAGFGEAPKFPPTLVLDALLARNRADSDEVVLDTLEAMARGGIHDQVGGGFHRYAVDAAWAVPHFEKMLSDNALLLGTYARGWCRVPDGEHGRRWLLEDVVRRLVGFLERELRLDEGAFAASLDADSADVRGLPHEGIYYLWNPELLLDALGEEDAAWAQEVFHVTPGGNVEHGLSTLQLRGAVEPVRLESVRQRLLAERENRFRPNLDDQVVAAWNGWLVDSLVQATGVFGEAGWLDLARQAADYLWRVHWVEGALRRTSRLGEPGEVPGAADDYGAVALGWARLAAGTGDPVWLERAQQLLDVALDDFAADDGGFWDTTAEDLYLRPREVADSATPSGTSALVAALRLVGRLSGETRYHQRADQALATQHATVSASPRFAGWPLRELLQAAEVHHRRGPAELVVLSDDPVSALAQAAYRLAPDGSVVLVAPAGRTGFEALLSGKTGVQTAYLCRGSVCQAPVTSAEELAAQLQPQLPDHHG